MANNTRFKNKMHVRGGRFNHGSTIPLETGKFCARTTGPRASPLRRRGCTAGLAKEEPSQKGENRSASCTALFGRGGREEVSHSREKVCFGRLGDQREAVATIFTFPRSPLGRSKPKGGSFRLVDHYTSSPPLDMLGQRWRAIPPPFHTQAHLRSEKDQSPPPTLTSVVPVLT